ncbi:MAG TPA: S1C family serine protease, partial [Gemmataceae bacterium]|nr:S1C family serine protease [Gemmataceae bacterium]
FGKMLATGKRRPAMTVTKAAISSLREDDNGELAVVQIDGGVDPGNSGGPVVNADGELVGVAVATISGSSGIGLAIPAGPLRSMFEGRIGAVHLALKPNSEKPALAIELSVIDPLNKITAVELHSIEISRVKADLDKGIESLEALPGIEKTKLTLEKQLASGERALASASSDKEYLVQAVYTTAKGKPRKTRVFLQSLQTPAVAGFNPNPAGSLPPVEFVDRAPKKGLLIGFEIGLGPFGPIDIVTAMRPIYRAEMKEVLGKQYGTIIKDVAAVKAKEGYAVGGMTLRTGALVNGLSLTFMRAQDGKLDPGDSYESDWIGDITGGSDKPRQGDGAPVIGIAGDTSDKYFGQLILVFEKSTAVATTKPDNDPSASKSGSSAGESGGGEGKTGGGDSKPSGNGSSGKERGDVGEATKILGGAGKPSFKDQAPEEGLLVGFEIGLGPAFGVELVKSIRPIYRTGDEDTLGHQHGTAPRNAVVVKAKEGYAVGGMTVRSGLVVNGFSV